MTTIALRPIGKVESRLTDLADAPRQADETFAVRLLKKGVPIQTVSVLLELNGEDSRILADVGTFRVASEQDLDIDPGR